MRWCASTCASLPCAVYLSVVHCTQLRLALADRASGHAELYVQHELENWRIRIRSEEGCAEKWQDWWGWMVKVRVSGEAPGVTDAAGYERACAEPHAS